MKSEPTDNKKKNHNFGWVIDESKCLSIGEVKRIRKVCDEARIYGLQNRKFSQVRNWFMIELGLNAGLRVEEMTSLKHGNLLIDEDRSSIVVTGKGGKKRAIWISSSFKIICQTYFEYKKRFGFDICDESYLLNNLKGNT